MKYHIENESIVFDDHYKIIKGKITHQIFNGEEITVNRFAFERGDSAAVLLFEKDTDSLLLTKQFRYPTCKHKLGWLVEIPAGSVEENEDPQDCIVREVMEELGYKIEMPELIGTFYTSPGASTERVFLFYAEVNSNDKRGKGGGQEGEKEDIQTVKIPITILPSKIMKFSDAKTLVSLQWFLLNRFQK